MKLKDHSIRYAITRLVLIAAIGFGILLVISFLTTPKAKAEIIFVDPEKTFLQSFAQGGIKQYQITEFQKYAVWIDGQNYYNVAGETNGNWTIISRTQLPTTTPTPSP
jgi:hypothetical protein